MEIEPVLRLHTRAKFGRYQGAQSICRLECLAHAVKYWVLPNKCEGRDVRQVTMENKLQENERRQRAIAVVAKKKDELMAALPLMSGVAKGYLSL